MVSTFTEINYHLVFSEGILMLKTKKSQEVKATDEIMRMGCWKRSRDSVFKIKSRIAGKVESSDEKPAMCATATIELLQTTWGREKLAINNNSFISQGL